MMKILLFITLVFTATYAWGQQFCPVADFIPEVINEYACSGQATKISIQVPQSSTAVFAFGDGTTGVGLETSAGAAIYETIDHTFNGTSSSTIINATVTTKVASGAYPAGFTCKITSMFARVILPPVFSATVDCAGNATNIYVDNSGPGNISGTVQFGDQTAGQAIDNLGVTHIFQKPGSYQLSANVTITATGTNGTYECSSALAQTITVPSCENFSCENTDLETGDFTRWDSYSLPYGCTSSSNDCYIKGPVANEHVIVSGAGKDPYGGFPIVASGGKYSLKIGNDNEDNSNECIASYFPRKITVDNAIFAYRIAAVIEAPDDNDFLSFQNMPSVEMYMSSGGEAFNYCSQLKLTTATTGFQKVSGKNVYYLGWTTLYYDLSNFIGSTLFINIDVKKGRYATTGETLKNLFAYVYFDSYCMPPPFQIVGNCINASTQFGAAVEGPFQENITWDTGDGSTLTGNNINYVYKSTGTQSVTMTYNPPDLSLGGGSGETCGGLKLTQQVQIDQCTPPNFVCEDCIPSFSPLPGQKYILQAWVKQGNGIGYDSYDAPGIKIDFLQGTTTDLFRPVGLIIDGWQRIEGEFTVPMDATKIKIELHNDDNTIEVFYDDIRVQPFNASMRAFVFDPVTLRMSAELDERNYATFFEYDEEGLLIRTKKETERGIKTLSESRSSLIKRSPKP